MVVWSIDGKGLFCVDESFFHKAEHCFQSLDVFTPKLDILVDTGSQNILLGFSSN